MLFATPEYNGSIPGHVKTAVDWASRPYQRSALWGKPVAVVGASTGLHGGISGQQELRKVLRTAGARVSEAGLVVARAHEQFDADGRLVSSSVRNRLASGLAALAAEAGGLSAAV